MKPRNSHRWSFTDVFGNEDSSSTAELRRRMDEFYATTSSYDAFSATATYEDEWRHVARAIRERVNRGTRCRVLEFGAGRTGFGSYLGELRSSVELFVQDVTPANEEFLRAQADHVCLGDIREISARFDVIFSTFVLEHVSDPRATLERLFEMLEPGGVMLLFCPRYDFPFYLSHSADHYCAADRFRLALGLIARRLRTLLGGSPAFLIHRDPAVFHLPFVRDRDAVHWISLFDLQSFFRGRATLRKLAIASGGGAKQWIVKRLLTVNLAISKPTAVT